MKYNRSDYRDDYLKALISSTGVVNCWPADEISGGMRDMVGRNHGVYNGTITRNNPPWAGIQSGAAQLDGTTGFLSIVAPTVNLIDTFTISVWVYPTSVTGTDFRIYDRAPSGAFQLILNLTANSGKWSANSQTSGTPITESTTVLAINTWYNLIWTKNGASNFLYQDGVDVTGVVTNATPTGATGDLFIGRHRSTSTNFFPGRIAYPTLWNRAIDKSEIINLLTLARGG